jgi:hypothetical protein
MLLGSVRTAVLPRGESACGAAGPAFPWQTCEGQHDMIHCSIVILYEHFVCSMLLNINRLDPIVNRK